GIFTLAVPLHQLERCGLAVAGSDELIEGRRLRIGRARLHVEWIAEAESVQRTAPRLEEGDDLVEDGDRPNARPRIKAPARLRKPQVPLFAAGRQRDDLVASFRPAGRAKGHVLRKPDLVETLHRLLRFQRVRVPRVTARASIPVTCASDLRNEA